MTTPRSTVCLLWSVVVVFMVFIRHGQSLKIQVYNNSTVIKTYTDKSAASKGRSVGIAYYEEITGILVYPNPRNACSTVDRVQSDQYIAFVPNYDDCSGTNALNINKAQFEMMITYSPQGSEIWDSNIAQGIVDKNFSNYLMENIIGNKDNKYDKITLVVTEDYLGFYEWLLLVIGLGLVAAISLIIVIFFCTCTCRYGIDKWRKRGLTNFRIRQLPRRRFYRAKEATESCSICLEDFKEREYLRVLPCDHVFHPSCVDEWLKNWNRVCPLCKASISRTGTRAQSHARTENQQQPLLSNLESGESSIYGSIRLSGDVEDRNNASTVVLSDSSTLEEDSGAGTNTNNAT